MSDARLYAVDVDGETLLVRASVYIPSARESADGEVADVDFVTVNGTAVAKIVKSDDCWERLFIAVVDAEAERRAAGREEAVSL